MTAATNSIPGMAALRAAATNDLRDIRPPVEIASGWVWAVWALAILGVVAIAWFLWRRWLKQRALLPSEPVVPAHVRAKRKLEEALAFIDRPREFCIMVSDAVRWYLEERFEFRAPERTTEEFLCELQKSNLLTAEQKDSLGQFLQSCDLVKFARYEPTERELRELHGSALRLVEETEPALQIPGSSPDMQNASPAAETAVK